jgi:hypothetical protein
VFLHIIEPAIPDQIMLQTLEYERLLLLLLWSFAFLMDGFTGFWGGEHRVWGFYQGQGRLLEGFLSLWERE